jgi:hypothetical protein
MSEFQTIKKKSEIYCLAYALINLNLCSLKKKEEPGRYLLAKNALVRLE